MSEYIDIYDPNMVKIGTKERQQAHIDGNWHKAFHCWIIYRTPNGEDMIVVQRRSSSKKLFPNALDITAAGHYEKGETIKEGLREVQEELGLDVDFEDLISLGVKFDVAKIGEVTNYEFDDVFLLEYFQPIEAYNFDPVEVSGIASFKIDDGLSLFSGEVDEISGKAVMAINIEEQVHFKEEEFKIKVEDFIPRIDSYVYKVLIMAKRHLEGEKHLAI